SRWPTRSRRASGSSSRTSSRSNRLHPRPLPTGRPRFFFSGGGATPLAELPPERPRHGGNRPHGAASRLREIRRSQGAPPMSNPPILVLPERPAPLHDAPP